MYAWIPVIFLWLKIKWYHSEGGKSDIPWGHLTSSPLVGVSFDNGHPQNPQEAILSVYLAAVNFRNGRCCIYKADTSDHLQ